MKNYSKEFWIKDIMVTVGTHWHDWTLLLRINSSIYRNCTSRVLSIEIFIDVLCFLLIVEKLGSIK